tara:strand:- start:266 stop:619 length:354 start_codon:yes stop_codon:yes gene_type:complete
MNKINIFENKYIVIILIIFLVGYSLKIIPDNKILKKIFQNSIFKIFILCLILYQGNVNPMLSLIIAICFIILMNMFSNKIIDTFDDDDDDKKDIDYSYDDDDSSSSSSDIELDPIDD